MENFPKKELAKVIQSGLTDSPSAFALSVGRLVAKLKHVDLELAQELSAMLPNGSALRGTDSFTPTPVDIDSRMQLVEVLSPVILDKKPVLAEKIKAVLDACLKEWASIDLLLKEGLAPAHMLLFCGLPGTGKTLAAHWLAQELKLPLLTLNLATVMSSYLGKTGSNLKAVFDHAISRPCVLLLDEFDAIAKRRDDGSDVGELKRLVNVLLQALDDWPANSMLVAATNHGELLDPAVWRRFDVVINFEKPDAPLIEQYLHDMPITDAFRQSLAKLLEGESFSAIAALVLSARKRALLEKTELQPQLFKLAVHSCTSRGHMAKPLDGEMLLMHLEGYSRREIAAHFGKTHPTVSSVIKRYLGE
ncbi:AAA family ATPase [Noviherbaspirillum sedimenti]|nr:AAA family ATPase [Noviherbaspirillum sedimenti]